MSPNQTDSVILVAFDAWKETTRAYHALPMDAPDRDGSTEDEYDHTSEEARLLAQIDGAEILIQHCKARTTRGVIAQLLVALQHIESDRETETTILDGDMDAIFAMDESFDWGARLVLAAIRSLQAMGETDHG